MSVYDLLKKDLDALMDLCQSKNICVSWNKTSIFFCDSNGELIYQDDAPQDPISYQYVMKKIKELL